jgi:hypothetical protein
MVPEENRETGNEFRFEDIVFRSPLIFLRNLKILSYIFACFHNATNNASLFFLSYPVRVFKCFFA